MGKLGKRKRQIERDHRVSRAHTSALHPPLESLSSPLDIDPINLAIALDTLTALAAEPSIARSTECKPLRAAAHSFQRAAALPEGGLSSKVSSAISDGRWLDARCLLAEMRIRNDVPKLGALQRWVRMCDAASLSLAGEESKAPESQEVWRVLEAILRTDEETSSAAESSTVLIRKPTWSVGDAFGGTTFADWESGRLNSPAEVTSARKAFTLLHTTDGQDRKPANLYPALIYTSPADTISASPPPTPVAKHISPFRSSVFLLLDVLPASTCRALVAAASAVGFTPDQPTSGTAAAQTSILAHNFFWLADPTFLSALSARLAPHLPSSYPDGATLCDLNARFRIYRYLPGAVYRPHFDGAWPPSGIDPTTGGYVYDASPPGWAVRSRLTLLIYLNDDFEGGETTFFLPRHDQPGLESWGVRPRCGSALVFPHGEAGGAALLHEGSGVVRGAKFVIRTDVLYGVRRPS